MLRCLSQISRRTANDSGCSVYFTRTSQRIEAFEVNILKDGTCEYRSGTPTLTAATILARFTQQKTDTIYIVIWIKGYVRQF